MKKNMIIALGAFVFLLGVLSNLQWAATNYGYKTASLHPQIMAQDTISGSGEKKGGDVSKIKYVIETPNCVFEVRGEANGTAKAGVVTVKLNAEGKGQVIYYNAAVFCKEGGEYLECKTKYCWEIFKECGTFLNN